MMCLPVINRASLVIYFVIEDFEEFIQEWGSFWQWFDLELWMKSSEISAGIQYDMINIGLISGGIGNFL